MVFWGSGLAIGVGAVVFIRRLCCLGQSMWRALVVEGIPFSLCNDRSPRKDYEFRGEGGKGGKREREKEEKEEKEVKEEKEEKEEKE